MIKVGVIGAGYIGAVHLDQLTRLRGVEVVKVVDASAERAQQAAQVCGAAYSDDYRDITDDSSIDVIHNCTPNIYHLEINRRALNNGKQVLSEKPLAMTASEAEELWTLSVQKRAVTGVNFCYRYYPVVQEAAARVRAGDIGAVRMAFGTWFQDWLSMDTDYSWRLDPKESGKSNITGDLGSHWFDLIQFVTGSRVTDVMGDFSTIIPVRKKPKHQVLAFEHVDEAACELVDCTLEEYASIHFRLDGNIPGSFTTCQTCIGRKSETAFEVYGSTASLGWNHRDATKLWIGNRFKPNEEILENSQIMYPEAAQYAVLPAGHPLGYYDAVLNLFKDFYQAVDAGGGDGETISRPTFKTGYDEMRILDAVVASNARRRWEQVGIEP